MYVRVTHMKLWSTLRLVLRRDYYITETSRGVPGLVVCRAAVHHRDVVVYLYDVTPLHRCWFFQEHRFSLELVVLVAPIVHSVKVHDSRLGLQ